MKLENINPFVRFARYLTIDSESDYPSAVPLDSRLFFVCGGYGEAQIGNDVFEMKKHSCLYIPAGTEYRLLTPEKSVTYLAVNFDFDNKYGLHPVPIGLANPRDFDQNMLINKICISDTATFSDPLYISSVNIENELTQIESEYSHRYENSDIIMRNLMHNILINFIRRKDAQTDNAVRLDIKKILDYICENCHKELTNTEIAAIFGFNPNYISDAIKKYTGFSMHKYLLHMRIIKSLTLLETRNYNIAEIANMCGFGETGYFSRYFKKEMGISPLKYMNTATTQ